MPAVCNLKVMMLFELLMSNASVFLKIINIASLCKLFAPDVYLRYDEF
jgi:hypothetical protein